MSATEPELKVWVETAVGILTLVAGLVAGLWAYTKLILERGFLPPSQMDVTCRTVGRQLERVILEVLVSIKNVGTNTLVASDIMINLRYLDKGDPVQLIQREPAPGRVLFPRSLKKDLQAGAQTGPTGRDALGGEADQPKGIKLVPHDTFVQAGVEQLYTFHTAVPDSTSFVRIMASFKYAQSPSRTQRGFLWLGRRLGLVQFTLTHVKEPHTVERIFRIAPDS